MTDSTATAWHDPTWVLAVMYYPNELVMLDKIAAGTFETLWRPDVVREEAQRTALRATTAGDTLAALYAMDQAPWHLTDEPSLGKAISLVGEMTEQAVEWRNVPYGKSEIHKRIAEYRRVWHLWAGWRLIRDEPDRPKRTEFAAEFTDLLGSARAVQEWACRWLPKHGEQRPLLENDAYFIPDSVPPYVHRWSDKPAPWIADALKKYEPRQR